MVNYARFMAFAPLLILSGFMIVAMSLRRDSTERPVIMRGRVAGLITAERWRKARAKKAKEERGAMAVQTRQSLRRSGL